MKGRKPHFLLLFLFGQALTILAIVCTKSHATDESSNTDYITPQSITGLRDGKPINLLNIDQAAIQNISSQHLLNTVRDFDKNITKSHLLDGKVFTAHWNPADTQHPSAYGSVDDSALFSGFYLASCSYRLSCEPTTKNWLAFKDSLRGIHILSHISGTSGVVVRMAIPLENSKKWFNYPEAYQHKKAKPFIYEMHRGVKDPFNNNKDYPPMAFMTKTTKDQFTGVLYGLSVAWAELHRPELKTFISQTPEAQQIKSILEQIINDIYQHLKKNNFIILDQENKSGTSAKEVTGLIRCTVLSLYKRCLYDNPLLINKSMLLRPNPRLKITPPAFSPIELRYHQVSRELRLAHNSTFLFNKYGGLRDLFIRYNLIRDYYAWNLRFARAFAYHMNLSDQAEDEKRKHVLRKYVDHRLFTHTRRHQNTFFIYARNAMQPSSSMFDKSSEALLALKSISLRPLRNWPSPLAEKVKKPSVLRRLFGKTPTNDVLLPHLREHTSEFIWQRSPYQVGKNRGNGQLEGIGLGLVLPYWLGRRHGFINKP